MKIMGQGIGLFLIILLFAGLSYSDASARKIQFSYQTTIEIPEGTKQINAWIPLAEESPYQQVLEENIITDEHYTIRMDQAYGNKILYFKSEGELASSIQFKIDYTLLVNQNEDTTSKVDAETKDFYLGSRGLMVVNERIKKIADEVVANEPNSLEKARKIYDYVVAHMQSYKEIPGWGAGDTLRACDLRSGNCTDFHSLFISIARAANLPARFKIGFQLPEDKANGRIKGYHCWAEFYLADRGWIPVDASEAWKNPAKKEYYFANRDIHKLTLSTGRSVPIPGSDFKANYLFYPYVEIDGQANTDVVKTEFSFSNVSS